MQVMITDSQTGRLKPLLPADSSLRMYVCGITPYDYAHAGHGRCSVVFDVVYRFVALLGYKVVYCRNYTDIDDKLIIRAQRELGDGNRYKEVADRFIAAYQDDMEKLGCQPPCFEPRVTDSIDEILAITQKIIDAGHAYVVDGSVYFSIDTWPTYGKLSKRQLEQLRAGARIAVNEHKRNPLDFALWKAEAEGSFWRSPWGWGRPGWHIECSAMVHSFLGEHIDLHGGGMDLLFPHHENELAQSEAAYGLDSFVKTWMHIAFVQVDKEKMSKSLGNFFTLRQLFEQQDPMVIRLMMLSHHYRSPIDFAPVELELAQKAYSRLVRMLGSTSDSSLKLTHLQESVIGKQLLAALANDINTQACIGKLFEHAALLQGDEQERTIAAAFVRQVLGLSLQERAEEQPSYSAEIEQLIALREAARSAKDFKKADEIRDQLKALGVQLQDKRLY
jgi:cysteinyl-tRNA synthetase